MNELVKEIIEATKNGISVRFEPSAAGSMRYMKVETCYSGRPASLAIHRLPLYMKSPGEYVLDEALLLLFLRQSLYYTTRHALEEESWIKN